MISRNNLAFGLFALLVLSVGFASAAAVEFNSVSGLPSTVNAGQAYTVTFTLSHTNTTFAGDFNLNWSTSDSAITTLPTLTTINATQNLSGSAVITIPSSATGAVNYVLRVKTYNSSDAVYYNIYTYTFSSAVSTSTNYEFCNWNGSRGFENGTDLEIRSVNDNKVDNENEWEWRPLDNIEVEVKVKNSGDDDEDYVVEIIFLDSNFNTMDVATDDDDLQEDVSIDSGDSETVTFNFTVDGDIDAGSYDVYVKVYQDGDEKLQCTSRDSRLSDIDDITVKKDKHDVIVKDVSGMNSVKAGSIVTYEVEVANLGREDEDQVKIWAYNSELGISKAIEIEELDSGDSETITFTINYPADAEEGAYKLKFSTEFNYDEDDETYGDESATEDDYVLSLGILAGVAKPTIGADLQSEANIGEQLIVKATITNNGASGNFVVSASGYDSWADLVSVTPQTATLAKGESAEVLVTLIPKTSGMQSFKVNTIVGGETYSQSVSVNIPAKENGVFGTASPTTVYLIGGIIALIVIILLVLIVRLAKAPKRKVSDY
jgi:hypothetical protein